MGICKKRYAINVKNLICWINGFGERHTVRNVRPILIDKNANPQRSGLAVLKKFMDSLQSDGGNRKIERHLHTSRTSYPQIVY